ncbi:hypothetical protein Golax_014972 [Gossypium laxum]|uniref:Uncharacterized protein n=1 Tax=Gossypium laxum TaxID=34288 RepID=A0A7J8ZWC0_9ROSI|nr:hypothetical protein [Gossypium laxum]
MQLIYFYVPDKHEIDTTIFFDDESMLAVACLQFGGNGNKGDEVVGSKSGEGDGGGKGDDVDVSKGREGDEGGEEWVRDESDSDSKDENAYLIKVMYLPEGDDDDDELQEARQNVKEVERETSGKGKETVLDETESESSRE